MTMEREELHDLLERLWDRYDREEFISADPIAVPHCFACLLYTSPSPRD